MRPNLRLAVTLMAAALPVVSTSVKAQETSQNTDSSATAAPTPNSSASDALPEVEVIQNPEATVSAPKKVKAKSKPEASSQTASNAKPKVKATAGQDVSPPPVDYQDQTFDQSQPATASETATGPVDGVVATRSATGTKTDTPLIETPQSISVVTADRVEQQRATTINEALRYTAGITTNLFGIDTRFDWLNIRGFDAYQPGFLIDGLITRNNDSWAVWKVEPYGAERIEVLKGPASVLYGQSNTGGTVNVISKKPLETPLNEIELRVGNHNRFETAFDFSGPVSENGKVFYRLTGIYSDSETQVDFTEQEEVFIAPALTWKPNASTSLTLLGQYRKDDTIPAAGTYLPNPQAEQRRSLFTGEPDYSKFDREQWSAGYILDHKFDSVWKLHHTARVASLDVDYATIFGAGSTDGDVTLNRSTFTSVEDNIAFTTDTNLQARFVSGPVEHTVLAGLDYQRNYFEQKSGFGFLAAPPLNLDNPVYGTAVITDPPLYNDSETILEQTGLYVQEQANIMDRLFLTFGGRYDWATTDYDDKLFGADTVKDDAEFTWRGSVLYKDASGLAPYYTYAQSFFPTATVDPATGQPFAASTGEQHEVGIKYEPHGFKGLFTAALFDLTRQNFVTFDSNFVPSARGEVQSRGLELEASAELVPGLDLIATYSKLFELVTTSSSDPAEIGQTLPLVPLESATLWMHYRIQDGAFAGFGFGGGVRYIGDSFGDLANSAFFSVPDFTLFDAVIDYEKDAWRLALNVANIEDELTYNCFDTCYLGTGRSIIASARYRW